MQLTWHLPERKKGKGPEYMKFYALEWYNQIQNYTIKCKRVSRDCIYKLVFRGDHVIVLRTTYSNIYFNGRILFPCIGNFTLYLTCVDCSIKYICP